MKVCKVKKCCTEDPLECPALKKFCKPDSSLEQVVDRVKIEGMLHILPDDKDRLCAAIRSYISERLPACPKQIELHGDRRFGWVMYEHKLKKALLNEGGR